MRKTLAVLALGTVLAFPAFAQQAEQTASPTGVQCTWGGISYSEGSYVCVGEKVALLCCHRPGTAAHPYDFCKNAQMEGPVYWALLGGINHCTGVQPTGPR
jgi:hypothetical protein